ncbi:MAG: tetratricopeptide repeat protein, partial [Chromatiaceae bacterium]|nr:tetratricopeptide repeat protein [Chromatiaceae bacterium]
MRRLFVMLLMSLVLVGCQTIPQGGGTATDFYNQGRAAYDVGDYNGALMNFQEAVRLDPRFGDAYYGL